MCGRHISNSLHAIAQGRRQSVLTPRLYAACECSEVTARTLALSSTAPRVLVVVVCDGVPARCLHACVLSRIPTVPRPPVAVRSACGRVSTLWVLLHLRLLLQVRWQCLSLTCCHCKDSCTVAHRLASGCAAAARVSTRTLLIRAPAVVPPASPSPATSPPSPTSRALTRDLWVSLTASGIRIERISERVQLVVPTALVLAPSPTR